MMQRICAGLVLGALCLSAHGARAQDDAHSQPENPPITYYWHNWADHNGVSHMTKCPLHHYTLKSMNKPAAPQWSDVLAEGQARIISTVQPDHWNGAWHTDPKVQWIIPLKGTWFVQAMDGTRVEMGPGEISLGEDQKTVPNALGQKGHLGGNVTPGSVTLMVIQLTEAPTVDQPCRFK
ncbi:cupin [Acetobacter pomorum]|uniref:Cupin n=1 Tax=Acetobacter pomorum TaxID=65959 RepID=A0A2G4RFF2_9PROT|nr:cupin [Acetobacter pomorum]PHY94465.1 cupin [Acetobacter pomorum]GBR45673.1 hypothetical protein AA11825_0108 [Acetobacter pomorum DSM 11825]